MKNDIRNYAKLKNVVHINNKLSKDGGSISKLLRFVKMQTIIKSTTTLQPLSKNRGEIIVRIWGRCLWEYRENEILV